MAAYASLVMHAPLAMHAWQSKQQMQTYCAFDAVFRGHGFRSSGLRADTVHPSACAMFRTWITNLQRTVDRMCKFAIRS